MTVRPLLVALMMLATAPAFAAPLSVTKTAAVVSDGVNVLNPKAIPGAAVDYAIVVVNPLANALATVGAVSVVDTLPAGVKLRVVDLGAAGSGPVEFVDGGLLGLGLLGSGLSFGYTSIASTADSIDFSTDGSSWTYVPVPDASGCDPLVRAIRVRLTGNQAAASGFRLRFRVVVK